MQYYEKVARSQSVIKPNLSLFSRGVRSTLLKLVSVLFFLTHSLGYSIREKICTDYDVDTHIWYREYFLELGHVIRGYTITSRGNKKALSNLVQVSRTQN